MFKANIMKNLSYIVAVVGGLLYCARFASSILCYDCNSAYDPRCGENFDSFSLGIINCSLRDPPEHLDPLEPKFCRSIKMEIDGKVRIVRQCGYLDDDEPTDQPCRRVVGNGDLFITYCTCTTDLCNSAGRNYKQMTIIISILLVLLSC